MKDSILNTTLIVAAFVGLVYSAFHGDGASLQPMSAHSIPARPTELAALAAKQDGANPRLVAANLN